MKSIIKEIAALAAIIVLSTSFAIAQSPAQTQALGAIVNKVSDESAALHKENDALKAQVAQLNVQLGQQNAIINVLAQKRTDAENEAIKAEAQVALDHPAQPGPTPVVTPPPAK